MIIRSKSSFPGATDDAVWYLAGGAPMPVAAYQPIGAASLADSYVNLANPGTNDAAPGVAPTWDATTGWGFNGVDQYLTTGIVPESGYSMIIRYTSFVAKDFLDIFIGSRASLNSRFYLGDGNNVQNSAIYGSGGATLVTPRPPVNADFAIAGQQGYRNGVAEGGAASAWNSVGLAIFVGCSNNSNVPGNFSEIHILAVAIYSATLTASQVAAVSAAMAAL
jgi:hypothetical protein